MNIQLINRVKECTTKVITTSNIEEQLLRQKAKVNWLRLGNGNNAYLHATLKTIRRQNHIVMNETDDGRNIQNQKEIEQEIVKYYENLVGTAQRELLIIDIVALRKGPQLTVEQRNFLIAPIIETKIWKSLKGIKDLSAPGIDGYNAKKFKSTWEIIKLDFISVVKDFFQKIKLYKAINCTTVTLIPNASATSKIKEVQTHLILHSDLQSYIKNNGKYTWESTYRGYSTKKKLLYVWCKWIYKR
ncbi:uncharacterized protein LOC131627231 [Vicia villosa]|uniref:uncharacterized protein LOC131627231 n=1 Tax=Vicia villosa TaxID=3911 RepID=UPI00273C9D42|nr:uncharacterized protein LOC131627231 [Vicia villosa]